MNSSFKPKENISLAPFTTLKVGGPARYFSRAETENDVVDGLAFADKLNLPVFILGGGSNLLIADAGFDGLVLQIGIEGISEKGSEVTAGAGEDWDNFVRYCVEKDLAGVECLSGIPGLVGGTPVQNVGAYGQEVAGSISQVSCYDRTAGEFVELSNAECGFSYRTSIFNSTQRDRYIVLTVSFLLQKGGKATVEYRDLKEILQDRDPTLAWVRNSVLEIRRSKSMVIDPDDPNTQSAGSFFKNPIVTQNSYDELCLSYGGAVPKFIAGDEVKIPAAWLIENSGFHKGFEMGNAGISEHHTLAIINRGGASSTDVIRLKDAIQVGVKNTFGIHLQPEPVFVGF